MESQPQNPEFRINPDNFHPCISELCYKGAILQRNCRKMKWSLTYSFFVKLNNLGAKTYGCLISKQTQYNESCYIGSALLCSRMYMYSIGNYMGESSKFQNPELSKFQS